VNDLKFEIIISSNSNYNNIKKEDLRNEFPFVRWIFNRKNLGFARAVNIGIKNSEGNYLMLINPDAYLLDNIISQLLQYMEENTDIGILGPRLIDNEGRIQDSFRDFITPNRFFWRVMKRLLQKKDREILEKKDYNSVQTTDWISGACMVVRKKAVEQVGLMDERYFLYIEDMDWCRRFWDKGFKIVYWPYMEVCHNSPRYSSFSLSKRRPNKFMWIHFISYMKFFWKFFPRIFWHRRVN